MRFNPRSPCGERRRCPTKGRRLRCFNPRSPCGERRRPVAGRVPRHQVSTHAPLAGSDAVSLALGCLRRVSTHAPLAGSDARALFGPSLLAVFQPTLPLRGATFLSARLAWALEQFQPTLPLRGATALLRRERAVDVVSTHAPLAGSDDGGLGRASRCIVVSTHAPLAGSDLLMDRYSRRDWFQPTLPLRGATYLQPWVILDFVFQPTLPLRGATGQTLLLGPRRIGFNPRSPCGERHRSGMANFCQMLVSTHAPLAGSDFAPRARPPTGISFNPRSPCGERPKAESVTN